MNTKIKSAEEILDKKCQPGMHWKLVNRYRVIQAMEAYHAQFKQHDIKVSQREVSSMADNIITVINNNTRDNIKESVINGINFLLSKSYPNHSK